MRYLLYAILSLGCTAVLLNGEDNLRSVYLRPEAGAPVIGKLPQGAFVMAPADPVELTDDQESAGWQPISYLADLTGFVHRTDLTKDLFVEPGAPIYVSKEQNPDNVVTHVNAEDTVDVGQLDGDWVEVSFRKPLVAYVRPESDKVAPVIGEGSSEPGVIFDNEKTAKAAGAPIADRGAVATDGILRAFEGQLSKPRSFFFFKPPYEFQLVDASGNRIAYLDLSRLLITTPLEHFLGREFHFYGRAEAIEGTRDFVIRVEQMRRR